MAAQAGPSRPRRTSAHPLASNARPSSSREEVDLSNLIARLSIQDIDELERNGMQGSQLTDAELALSIFAEDARSLITFNSDRALAMALNEEEPRSPVFHANRAASRPPSVMMSNVQTLDPMLQRPNLHAQPDRAPAQTVSRNNNTASWSEWFLSAVNWFVGSPPTRSAPVMPSTHLTGQNCVICQDPIRGGQIRAPCGHYYDIACVTDLFQSATRDESLFPPRCCRQPIPIMTVRHYLTPVLIALFIEKEKEFATLKRVYCAKPSCSRFLGSQSRSIFGSVMTCPAPGCLTRTCRSCRSKVASGDLHNKCKVDEMDQQILALGKDAGWARCPGCAQMIELQMGCYHMTCRCKTEFCYLCTARWKTCTCTQWDERRLVAAAEERVDLQYQRPHGPRVVIAQADPRQPAQAVQPRAMAASRQRPVIPTQNARGDIAVRDELNPRRVPGAAVTPRTYTATLAAAVRRLQPTSGNLQSVEDTALSWRAILASTSPLRTHPTVPTVRPPNPVANFDTSVRDRLVREAIEDLRVNHDCQHTKWRYRSGGGQCRTCYSQLPLYLFRCVGCQTLACNRCRRNRL